MRFVSQYAGYNIVAVHQEVEVLANGKPRVVAPGYMVQFNKWDATDRDREVARKTFTYTGTVMDKSGRMLDPIDDQHRVSTFDTNVIDNPGLRAAVEKALLGNADFGRSYVLVEEVQIEPPYKRWDTHRKLQGRRTLEHVLHDIRSTFEGAGFEIDQAVAYERQHPGQASEQVLAALEELRNVEPAEDLVIA